MMRRQCSIIPRHGRGFFTGPDVIGRVHPDVHWGNVQTSYRGPGWMAWMKSLPVETFIFQGGFANSAACYDRQGWIVDPEDPRHPFKRWKTTMALNMPLDGSMHSIVNATWGPIPVSSRFLQVLYDHYLEPFSFHRWAAHLSFYGKVVNHNDGGVKRNLDYCGETVCFAGTIIMGCGTVVLDGTTFRADTNQIYISEGCQIMENCCFIADAPATLHHYQRREYLNPYQTLELMEGVIRIGNNCVIEPNCHIESCQIANYCKIGHNSKILKGVTTGVLCHILPGSVVLPDTKLGEGEVWGGAPAEKLGKVNKFEWKRPYFVSIMHREMSLLTHMEHSRYGDQVGEYTEVVGKIQNLLIKYEDDVSDGVKARIRTFIEGHEPFTHTIARHTQGWSPANRSDQLICGDFWQPMPYFTSHRDHNDDAGDSPYIGTLFNLAAFHVEKKW